jgi:putative heme iron utilization protein
MSNDAHAAPASSRQALLYDESIPTPTHAERARTLAARLSTGTLCTLAQDPPGHPYGSFVTVAFDGGDPVFLISELAEHTKNLHGDPRASLMVAAAEADDPLANGRITLIGTCTRAKDREAAAAAYLARHPNAAYYADFRDFGYWRLDVAHVRYIGGYGRMSWVSAADWSAAEPDPLAPHAAGIVGHMNDDHADALPLYCRAFSRASAVEHASMTAIDRYGFEMSATTPEGPRPIRVAFAQPIATPAEARKVLVAMLHEARATLGEPRAR